MKIKGTDYDIFGIIIMGFFVLIAEEMVFGFFERGNWKLFPYAAICSICVGYAFRDLIRGERADGQDEYEQEHDEKESEEIC